MADTEQVSQTDAESETVQQDPELVSATDKPPHDQTNQVSGDNLDNIPHKDTEDTVTQEPPVNRPEPQCPRVNCPEKILFCFDFSSEMSETFFRSRVGDKLSAQTETLKALRMYVMNKNRINQNHQFGLAVLHDSAVLIKGFTSKPKEFLTVLEEFDDQSQESKGFDLTTLFEMIKSEVALPVVEGDVRLVPPPFIIRVVIIYGRSHHEPYFSNPEVHLELEASPYFFVDVLYVHEPPSEENKCEEIFSRLCDLDHKGMSYILEASNLTRLFDSMAKLLAHPLQRPVQREADYHISSTPPTEAQVALG
ncbi:hypothetical protein BaRGS_00018294 [Batillaria attramentaria]|uniref:BRISC and BRCA1-A complex member 1 n=1 Tax=Batillaria attramentaria TaxID=370345 RepID=A0ABD0K6Z3_9CAEN